MDCIMEQQLWMGTAKIDITPKQPVELAGFESRLGMGGFLGVVQPLYARMIYYRHVDVKGRESQALLVSADIIWWDNERSAQLRKRLSDVHGIPANAILLHGTHTHSGPQTSDQFTAALGTFDLSYVQQLEEWAAEGVSAAIANEEPVTAGQGTGSIHLGMNRRLMVDGQCFMQPNPQGPTDPELRVIGYSRLDGSAKAILIHYTCHPVITREHLVSSEFTGYAMSYIEEAVGEQVVAAYLQGWCGDINPWKQGDAKDVRQGGQWLAEEALKVLKSGLKPLLPCGLIAGKHQVRLPFQALPSEDELLVCTSQPGIIGEWSRKLLEQPDRRLQKDAVLDIYRLPLAEQLSVLAVNSEVVVEYGLYLKQLSYGRFLPLGYTNGMIGYVPTARQLGEGGYEADQSTKYFLLPSSFDSAIDYEFRAVINQLVLQD